MKNGLIDNKIKLFIGGLLLASVLLFPEINIRTNLPSFQLIDFLFPFLCVILFVERKRIVWNSFYSVFIVFTIYILFTIIYNKRQEELRDYFELYKLAKFFVVLLFFTRIDFEKFIPLWIKPIFILLVVANLTHYFNFFDINKLIESYYDGGVHIQTFGLDSLGRPTYKRMLGLSGNPNINGIVFGFFSILFYPKKESNKYDYLLFSMALLMLFLCQSRTNLIAITFVLGFTFLYQKAQMSFHLKVIGVSLLVYLMSFIIASNSYLNSLFVEKVNNHSSLMGRFEVWKYLWEMIKEKPLFGHAPYKEYFYERNLYSENEFILQTWRYGFVGLILFLYIILFPFYKAIRSTENKYSLEIIQFSLIIFINSLTNNPFSDRITMVLFAIMIGLSFNRNFKSYE